jgi:capsular polysaccharide biosynthesis protein
MNYSQILAIIKQKKGLIIISGLLLAAVSFWGVMLFSPRYQSNFDVLIVQNQQEFVDSYTLAKSTEHFSKLLSEGIYTETFLGKVIENYPALGKTLPIDREDRMEKWGKMVRTSLNVELGIIHIKVLAGSRADAEAVSKTVAGVLASNSNLFISENQKIEARMINAPIVKMNPGAGVLAAITAVSFFIGALLAYAASFYKSLIASGSEKTEDSGVSREEIWQE